MVLHADEPAPLCANRLFEWIVSLMMLGIAVAMALPGNSLETGQFRYLAQAGFTEVAFMLFFFIVGTMRVLALYLNGQWPVYGPRCRIAGAAFGGVLWAQMALILVLNSMITGVASIGVPVYALLSLGELLSCYRATIDADRAGRR